MEVSSFLGGKHGSESLETCEGCNAIPAAFPAPPPLHPRRESAADARPGEGTKIQTSQGNWKYM